MISEQLINQYFIVTPDNPATIASANLSPAGTPDEKFQNFASAYIFAAGDNAIIESVLIQTPFGAPLVSPVGISIVWYNNTTMATAPATSLFIPAANVWLPFNKYLANPNLLATSRLIIDTGAPALGSVSNGLGIPVAAYGTDYPVTIYLQIKHTIALTP